MFVPFDAAQYRALDADAFEQRKNEVVDLMNAEALPEGVTDEVLFAEADIIEAEVSRRNRVAALEEAKLAKRAAAVKQVESGAAKVVESNAPEAKPATSGFEVVRNGNYTDSVEYRTALANFFTRTAPMPADMLAKAYAEYRSNDAVSLNAGYTNMTDPTFTSTYSAMVPIPITLSNEIMKEMHNYGGLYEKVNHTNFPGGYVVAEGELGGDASWITDKETSPYYTDPDFKPFSFSAHQLEYRHARSLLAQAMMSDNFKNIAPDIADKFTKQLNLAVWGGNGTGKPLGITVDTRLIGTTSGGTTVPGKAVIIEVTASDLSDWSFWTSVLFTTGFNGAYRNVGEWFMGDGTWGKYLLGLKDDNNRPIANFMSTTETLNVNADGRLNGRPATLMDSTIVKGFDEASAGDIVAVFGNPRYYTINTQPGMPLSTVAWDDHDHNLHKTKVLMACDGRVTNSNGWLFLKKKASA